MKLYLFIWTFSAIRIDGFILKNSYNFQVEDGFYNKPNTNGDFEMLDKQHQERLEIENKENIFYDLNRLASKEYGKQVRKSLDWPQPRGVNVIRYYDNKASNKRTYITRTYSRSTHRVTKKDVIRTTTEVYDYDLFLSEYIEEAILREKLNQTYVPQTVESADLVHRLKRMVSLDNTQKQRGTDDDSILRRLFVDCKNQQCSTKEILVNVWIFVKIWLCVYLIVAIPLWTTKGWCCCCLCCKCFNPRRTIQKAKLYLTQNPPGILNKGKEQTLYEPTEEERESYKQFEHLIKII